MTDTKQNDQESELPPSRTPGTTGRTEKPQDSGASKSNADIIEDNYDDDDEIDEATDTTIIPSAGDTQPVED